MTKILDQAIDAVRSLSPEEQDDIAREMRSLALQSQGFKPVPGGYVFRVPSPWTFGRPDHYLVTDAQIEEIRKSRNTKSDMVLAVLANSIVTVVLVLAVVALSPAIFLLHGELAIGQVVLWLGVGGIMVLVNVHCFSWLTFRRLRPILVRLPRMKE